MAVKTVVYRYRYNAIVVIIHQGVFPCRAGGPFLVGRANRPPSRVSRFSRLSRLSRFQDFKSLPSKPGCGCLFRFVCSYTELRVRVRVRVRVRIRVRRLLHTSQRRMSHSSWLGLGLRVGLGLGLGCGSTSGSPIVHVVNDAIPPVTGPVRPVACVKSRC